MQPFSRPQTHTANRKLTPGHQKKEILFKSHNSFTITISQPQKWGTINIHIQQKCDSQELKTCWVLPLESKHVLNGKLGQCACCRDTGRKPTETRGRSQMKKAFAWYIQSHWSVNDMMIFSFFLLHFCYILKQVTCSVKPHAIITGDQSLFYFLFFYFTAVSTRITFYQHFLPNLQCGDFPWHQDHPVSKTTALERSGVAHMATASTTCIQSHAPAAGQVLQTQMASAAASRDPQDPR